jgi:hypothetical protein
MEKKRITWRHSIHELYLLKEVNILCGQNVFWEMPHLYLDRLSSDLYFYSSKQILRKYAYFK